MAYKAAILQKAFSLESKANILSWSKCDRIISCDNPLLDVYGRHLTFFVGYKLFFYKAPWWNIEW